MIACRITRRGAQEAVSPGGEEIIARGQTSASLEGRKAEIPSADKPGTNKGWNEFWPMMNKKGYHGFWGGQRMPLFSVE